jgi:hypothetical protein
MKGGGVKELKVDGNYCCDVHLQKIKRSDGIATDIRTDEPPI